MILSTLSLVCILASAPRTTAASALAQVTITQGAGVQAGPMSPTSPTARPISPTPRIDFPEVDFVVHDLARDGDRLFLGGNFQRLGRVSGSLVRIDDATAALIPSAPRFNGFVHAAVSDENGGAFVGGDFSIDGSPLTRLAHILADRSVVPVTTGFDSGSIRSLAFDSANGVLYVVGGFLSVGGVPRSRAAAFDVTSGALLPWNPDINAPDFAQPPFSVVLAGGRVWIGGMDFHDFDTNPNDTITDIRNLVTCDPATGTLDTHDFALDDYVACMTESGGRVFVGGGFASVRGTARGRLAAFSAATRVLDSLDIAFDQDLRALTVDGTELFVGGFFTHADGQVRHNAASIDLQTASLTNWKPLVGSPGLSGTVSAILVNNSGVFLGGTFSTVSGEPHRDLVLVDRATAAPLGANHGFAGQHGDPGQVLALVQVNNQVIAAGSLFFEKVVFRRHVAAVDIPSGTVDDTWQPPTPDDDVEIIDVNSTAVFIAGPFDTVGGVTRNHLAAVDLTTSNLVTSFVADLSGAASTDIVALAASDTKLFVAIQSYWPTRYDVLALDPQSGQPLLSFQPQIGGGSVHALELSKDGQTLYVGGYFSQFGSPTVPRAGLAAIDATTGALSSWNPQGCEAVYALAIQGSSLYAAGYVDVPLYGLRDYSLAFDLQTAALTPWAPPLGDVSSMWGVALETAPGRILIGANFFSFGGSPANTAAAVDLVSGQNAEWKPEIIGTAGSFVSHPDVVIVGGNYSRVGDQSRQSLAAFSYK